MPLMGGDHEVESPQHPDPLFQGLASDTVLYLDHMLC